VAFSSAGGLNTARPVHAAGLSISGVIWADSNADGVRQASEEGWPLSVVLSNGQDVRANARGEYAFHDLAPGLYTVRLHASTPRFQYQTYPVRRGVGPYEVAVSLSTSRQRTSTSDSTGRRMHAW
jgi:hypothetical protein